MPDSHCGGWRDHPAGARRARRRPAPTPPPPSAARPSNAATRGSRRRAPLQNCLTTSSIAILSLPATSGASFSSNPSKSDDGERRGAGTTLWPEIPATESPGPRNGLHGLAFTSQPRNSVRPRPAPRYGTQPERLRKFRLSLPNRPARGLKGGTARALIRECGPVQKGRTS